MVARHLPRSGQSLRNGRYLLVAPLGRGGQATVWRARDTRARGADADVALKLLPADDGGAEAAAREAEVTARVAHPNVVRVRDTFADGPSAGIVMEIGVCSLADLVEDTGPLPVEAALDVVLQACAGLAAAHAAGVVHRDVKPHNLLLFADGTVKIGDFGVARAEAHTRTRSANVLGSVPFMAPEQRRDPRAVRPATDVYAMAVTLAWLLTGRAPGDLFAPGVLGELVESGVPVAVAEVLVRAGAYDAAARFLESGALREALVAACGESADGRAWLAERARSLSGAAAGIDSGAAAGGVVVEGSGGVFWGGGPRPPATPPGSGGATPWSPPVIGVLVTAGAAVAAFVGVVATRLMEVGASATPTAALATLDTPWCADAAHGFSGLAVPGPRETLAVVAADVDGDGARDALYMNQLDESVTIWWGRRRGLPGDRTDVPAARSAFAPLVTDVDVDGTNDLVVAATDDAALTVLRGLGRRAFAAPLRIPQAPAPRNLGAVASSSGVSLVMSGGGLLMARVAGSGVSWRPHRTLTPFTSFGAAAFVRRAEGTLVALSGPSPMALTLDRELVIRRRESPDGWPRDAYFFAADLLDGDDEELYAITAARGVVRVPIRAGEPLCRVAPDASMPESATLAHMDDDGIPDLVSAETCSMCTSSHSVQFGQPG